MPKPRLEPVLNEEQQEILQILQEDPQVLRILQERLLPSDITEDLNREKVWHVKDLEDRAQQLPLLIATTKKETIILDCGSVRSLLPTGAAAREGGVYEQFFRKLDIPDYYMQQREIGPTVDLDRLTAHDLAEWFETEQYCPLPLTGFEILLLDEPYFDVHDGRLHETKKVLDAPVPPRPRVFLDKTDRQTTFAELGFQRLKHMIVVRCRSSESQEQPDVEETTFASSPSYSLPQTIENRAHAGDSNPVGGGSTLALGHSGTEASKCKEFLRYDVVEIHSLAGERGTKYNGQQGIVHQKPKHLAGDAMMVVRLPLLKNERLIVSPLHCKLIEEDLCLPDFESGFDATDDFETEGKGVSAQASQYNKEAALVLGRIRTLRGLGWHVTLRHQLKRANFLLDRKTPAHSKSAGQNIIRGKLRKQLTGIMKLARQDVEQKEKGVCQQLRSESAGDAFAETGTADGPHLCSESTGESTAPSHRRVQQLREAYTHTETSHFKMIAIMNQHDEEQTKVFDGTFDCPELGSLTFRCNLDASLSAIARHRITPFKRVHLPDASCEEWCDESEQTRRALFHVGWLYKHIGSLGELREEPEFQDVGLSFFAQAAPSIVGARKSLCLPFVSECGPFFRYPTQWLYLFWDGGCRPIVAWVPHAPSGRCVEWLSDVVFAGGGREMFDTCSKPDNNTSTAARERGRSKMIPRAFWISRRLHSPDLIDIESRAFLAVEIIYPARFLAEGRKRFAKKERLSANSASDGALLMGHELMNDTATGLRYSFLRGFDNSLQDVYFFSPRDSSTGELLPDTWQESARWCFRRMHWLTRLAERQMPACLCAIFEGGQGQAFGRPAHSLVDWITRGDRSETDQPTIAALEAYLLDNGLVGDIEQGRRALTGRVPFAPSKAEDPVDLFLEDLFWVAALQLKNAADTDAEKDQQDEDRQRISGRAEDEDDLSASQLLEAALVGCDDVEGLRQALDDTSGGCVFGPGMKNVQAAAAKLLWQSGHGIAQPKMKTRGAAGDFKLETAQARAAAFREKFEAETGISADEAMRDSALKAGAKWDVEEDTLGGAVSEKSRLERARTVLGLVAQKRMRWRQTKRGLRLLCKTGLLGIEAGSPSDDGARPRLRLNCRGSHHVLHGPGGAATIVRPHKGTAPLTEKEFAKQMERITEIAGDA